MTNYYESDRAMAEYLLFHYGSAERVAAAGFGARGPR